MYFPKWSILLLLERFLERSEDPLLFWFLQRYLAGFELVSEVVNERQGLLLCFRKVCVKKNKPSAYTRRQVEGFRIDRTVRDTTQKETKLPRSQQRAQPKTAVSARCG